MEKKPIFQNQFSHLRALRASFPFSLAVLATFCVLGAVASGSEEAGQDQGMPDIFQAGAREHVGQPESARSRFAGALGGPQTVRNEIEQRLVVAPPAVLASNVSASITSPGVVITPTFDSTILNNPNSAAIQAMISQAIAIYQAVFRDPINVNILFRYSNTTPSGGSMGTALARSNLVVYTIPWNTVKNALVADAKTGNDATANASLPASPLSPNLVPSSANGRALGLNTPPAMFANGSVAAGGPYDGIVTLNSNQPFQFSRPPSANNVDALRSTEHEIDEILGLGSFIGISSDLNPQDLFSWSAPNNRNLTSNGSRYFSINSGNTNIVDFNQEPDGDFGDWLSDSCPQANPYVQNAFSCRGQFSDVTASSPEGINLDVVGYDLASSNPTPTPSPSRLLNIATRMRVQTGDNVLIGGFIITGSAPRHLLLRAIGPSLTGAGIPNALADPILELHGPGAFATITNDNWRDNPAQEAAILATGLQPTNNLEAAIDATLAPGAYTAIVGGQNGATGTGLVEIYNLSQDTSSMLANISTRGFVNTGDDVMIGGLIVGGASGTARVMVRALGPSIPVAGALSDPTLDLRDGNGAQIAINDDWRSDQQAEIIATGLAPADNRESAIVRSLSPGPYTAIVRGKNNAIGVALVEAYQLP